MTYVRVFPLRIIDFGVKIVMEMALSECKNGGIITSHRKLPDLEHAVNVALLSEDLNKLQVFLDFLDNKVGIFEIYFAPF